MDGSTESDPKRSPRGGAVAQRLRGRPIRRNPPYRPASSRPRFNAADSRVGPGIKKLNPSAIR